MDKTQLQPTKPQSPHLDVLVDERWAEPYLVTVKAAPSSSNKVARQELPDHTIQADKLAVRRVRKIDVRDYEDDAIKHVSRVFVNVIPPTTLSFTRGDAPKPNRPSGFAKIIILFAIVLGLTGATFWALHSNLLMSSRSAANSIKDLGNRLNRVEIKVNNLETGQLPLNLTHNLHIHGQLKVSDSIVLAPSAEPNHPVAGQIYFDKAKQVLSYYDGSQFIDLEGATPTGSAPNTAQETTNPNGSVAESGSFVVGDGLSLVSGRLNNDGVLSLQGLSGDITLTGGDGITINGTTISNDGVLSFGGRAGDITLGSGLGLSSQQQLSNTGVLSLGGVAGVVGVGNGLVMTTDGQLTNAGVISLDTLTGPITLSNSSSNGSTVTIDDASTANKGIAQFNGTNFSAAGGIINTVQDINTSAKPSFGQLILTSSVASGTMLFVNNTNPSAGGSLIDLRVNNASQFSVTSGGAVAATGNLNLTGPGAQYQVNGLQIATSNLSDGSNIALLSTPNTFTAAITINGSSDTTQLLVKGNSNQNSSILVVQTSGGANLVSVGQTGAAVFQNSTNSTTAFKVQNTAGNAMFVVDTTNLAVKIGGGDVSPSSTPTLLVLSNKNTSGDPSGVAGATYYNTKSQTSRCYEGIRGWTDCTGTPKPGNRPWAYIKYTGAVAGGASNTSLSNLGDQADSDGTGTKTAIATTTTEPAQLDFATTSTNGNVTDIFGNTNYVVSNNPDFQTYVALTATTNIRLWMGLTDQTAATMAASANPVGNYAAFRYDTSASDTTYKCVTKNGTTQTVTNSGTTVSTAGHKFEVIISGSQAEFKIDGVDVCTNTATLPASTSLMRYTDSATTLTAAVAHFRVAWAYIESDR